ncbi:MAG: hypothetical protein ACRDRJ_22555 [Streptosporangiaceae bacterium]
MRSRKNKQIALTVLSGTLTYSLAGCDNGCPATDGPLNGPFGTPSGHVVCTAARVGQPIAFGLDTFTNHGHTAIALDRVGLLQPRHERLVGSYAAPGVYIAGVVNWPPRHPPTSRNWKDRQAVHGFRLAPRKSFNMVLGVIATATGGATSQGMRIYYHNTAGRRYLAFDHNKLIIDTAKRGCN